MWHGLAAGDPVVISGIQARGATWEFRAHVVNSRNDVESIEVIGGRPGDRKIRSFAPDRVYPVTGRRVRAGGHGSGAMVGPSLAEAPRLPFA